MKIVLYGNKQAGMVGLLTAKALGHQITEVWEDDGHGIPGIDRLLLRRKTIYSKSDFSVNEGVDLLLCVHGRKIVPEDVLAKFRFGGINLHPFLDKYPGAKPVERAILSGEKEAKVCAHRMTSEVDRGEILIFAKTIIPTKFERPELDPIHIYNELYALYAEVVAAVLKKLTNPTVQEE